MKNIFKSILALVCCGAFLASCEQEVPETEMSVDLTSIDAEAQNPEEVAVTLTTNATWILTCPEWVTPSATYGTGDAILTFAIGTNYKDETTTTRARSGEIKISGGGTLTGKGAVVTIAVNQQGYTYVDPNPSIGGIPDADEFAKFIVAANNGGSLKRWTSDEANEVRLLADIDLTGVEIDWQAIADATSTSNANNASLIVENTTPFEGVFNGDNHKITGFNPVVTLGANKTFGLFAVAHNATIKNVELSVSPEGDLVVGIPDGYESDYFTRFPENIQALEDFLEDRAAKHVPVKIVPISQTSEFEKQYPDTSELIRMDLLEEGFEEE